MRTLSSFDRFTCRMQPLSPASALHSRTLWSPHELPTQPQLVGEPPAPDDRHAPTGGSLFFAGNSALLLDAARTEPTSSTPGAGGVGPAVTPGLLGAVGQS